MRLPGMKQTMIFYAQTLGDYGDSLTVKMTEMHSIPHQKFRLLELLSTPKSRPCSLIATFANTHVKVKELSDVHDFFRKKHFFLSNLISQRIELKKCGLKHWKGNYL